MNNVQGQDLRPIGDPVPVFGLFLGLGYQKEGVLRQSNNLTLLSSFLRKFLASSGWWKAVSFVLIFREPSPWPGWLYSWLFCCFDKIPWLMATQGSWLWIQKDGGRNRKLKDLFSPPHVCVWVCMCVHMQTLEVDIWYLPQFFSITLSLKQGFSLNLDRADFSVQ